MTLEFQAVLDAARRGLPATLELEVEGRTYVRSFRPGEHPPTPTGARVAGYNCARSCCLQPLHSVLDRHDL